MKRKYYILFFIFFISANIHSNNLDDIKKKILDILIEYEDWESTSIEDISNSCIVEIQKSEPLDENKTGIFLFNLINFHGSYAHFILIEKDRFEIINMRDAFEDNIKKLIEFLSRNEEYSKNDVLFYVSTFIRVHENNTNPIGVVTKKRIHNVPN
jgi:hypothetical protein